jgi:hypothetical protein
VNTDEFLAAALRNPVNEEIAGELFRMAATGCVDRLGMPGANRMERADESRG